MLLLYSSSEASSFRTGVSLLKCGLSTWHQELGKGSMQVKVLHLGTSIPWMSVRILLLYATRADEKGKTNWCALVECPRVNHT